MEQALAEFLLKNPASTAEEIKSGLRRQGLSVDGRRHVFWPKNCLQFLHVSTEFAEAWVSLANKNNLKWKGSIETVITNDEGTYDIPLTNIPRRYTKPHYLCATYEYEQ